MVSVSLISAGNHGSSQHIYQTLVKFVGSSMRKTKQGVSFHTFTTLGNIAAKAWLKQVREQLQILNELALENNQECLVLLHTDLHFELDVYKSLEGYLHKLTRVQGIFSPKVCVDVIKKCYPPGYKVGVVGGRLTPEVDIYTHLLKENGYEPVAISVKDMQKPIHSCEVMLLAFCDETTQMMAHQSYKGTTILVDPARVMAEYLLQKI